MTSSMRRRGRTHGTGATGVADRAIAHRLDRTTARRARASTGPADGEQHAVALDDFALMRVVDARQRDLLGGDELPDVELGPVAQREGAQLLALADAGVQQIPRLWPLVARVPPTMTIAERQDALLGPRLVFVATSAPERGIEAVLGDCVEQRHRLQTVAAGPRTRVFDHSAVVDRLLHAGDDQPGTDALHELVADTR